MHIPGMPVSIGSEKNICRLKSTQFKSRQFKLPFKETEIQKSMKCFLVFFQILDLGLIFHPGAYLRDVWNFMDSTVVSCALISIYFQ